MGLPAHPSTIVAILLALCAPIAIFAIYWFVEKSIRKDLKDIGQWNRVYERRENEDEQEEIERRVRARARQAGFDDSQKEFLVLSKKKRAAQAAGAKGGGKGGRGGDGDQRARGDDDERPTRRLQLDEDENVA
jgi:hypothetical protein